MSGGRIPSRTNSGASSIRGRPGISARAMPAMTRRIEGAVLNRRATRATTTSTAINSISVWIVTVTGHTLLGRSTLPQDRPRPIAESAAHATPLQRRLNRSGREFEDFLVLQVGVGSAVSASLARQIENAVDCPDRVEGAGVAALERHLARPVVVDPVLIA